MPIHNFVSEFLQKLRSVRLSEFQPELEQRNFESLSAFVPNSTHLYIKTLLKNHNVNIYVVRGRNSKLGDYRPVPKGQIPTITLNNNLNSLSFLVTFLHEWAHLLIDEQFGRKVKPHGREWKDCYKFLLIPIIESEDMPIEFREVLKHHYNHPKASALGDPLLAKYLKQIDNHSATYLEDLELYSHFELANGLILQKGEKRRTKYLCKNLNNGKEYIVHALAEVKEVEPEEVQKPETNIYVTHLEDLELFANFKLANGLTLQKGVKRRTRFLCKDLSNNRQYTVHALVEVEEIKADE